MAIPTEYVISVAYSVGTILMDKLPPPFSVPSALGSAVWERKLGELYPSDFRTSFSGLSQGGWEMELEWVGGGGGGLWGIRAT